MNYTNVESIVHDIIKVSTTSGQLQSLPKYFFAYVYGSMNYAPERAKDVDIRVLRWDETCTIDINTTLTLNSLPVDIHGGRLLDMDIDHMFEIITNLNDPEKTIFLEANHDGVSNSEVVRSMIKSYINLTLSTRGTVRKAISEKCSNSFVKAKKKLLIEKDYNPYVSMKSLWHSIRIYNYANQYAKEGRVYDFRSCEGLWEEIKKDYENHDVNDLVKLISTKYKKIQNKEASIFKMYYPKK